MASFAQERPETFRRIVEALVSVGVVANESGQSFTAQELFAIENDMRAAGYAGGAPIIGHPIRPRDGIDLIFFDGDRFESSERAEQAWTEDYLDRWRDRIKLEVDDWLGRLSNLRAQMKSWIDQTPAFSSLRLTDLNPAPMMEHIMQRFGVAAARMPVFEFRSAHHRVLRFQPKGLWVIGANGRVDLVTKSASPILVDQSEPLSAVSDWRLFYSKDGKSMPFVKESFDELLRGGMP